MSSQCSQQPVDAPLVEEAPEFAWSQEDPEATGLCSDLVALPHQAHPERGASGKAAPRKSSVPMKPTADSDILCWLCDDGFDANAEDGSLGGASNFS